MSRLPANLRKLTDLDRFVTAAAAIVGKRLTYSDLTGQELATT